MKALRRTASGAFGIESALYGDGMTAESISERLIPLREACGALRRVELTEDGVGHARHGRPIRAADLVGDAWREAGADEALALFAPDGEPVALGRRIDDGIRVARGFTTSTEGVVSP